MGEELVTLTLASGCTPWECAGTSLGVYTFQLLYKFLFVPLLVVFVAVLSVKKLLSRDQNIKIKSKKILNICLHALLTAVVTLFGGSVVFALVESTYLILLIPLFVVFITLLGIRIWRRPNQDSKTKIKRLFRVWLYVSLVTIIVFMVVMFTLAAFNINIISRF